MIRSLGFGSNKNNFKYVYKIFITLFKILRFLYAYFYQIKLAIFINLLAHYAKGTLLLLYYLKASIDCQFKILELFNSSDYFFTFPLQYFFTIGYLLLGFEGGSPFFKKNSTYFFLLIISISYNKSFFYRTFTFFSK